MGKGKQQGAKSKGLDALSLLIPSSVKSSNKVGHYDNGS